VLQHLAAIGWPVVDRFRFGDAIAISPHGLGIAIGFMVGAWLFTRLASRRGIPIDPINSVIFWSLIGALVGSRVAYVIAHVSEFESPLEWFAIWRGGISLLGGIAGATIANAVSIRRQAFRFRFFQIADTIAPCLALGIMVGRIGDLVIGDHLGKPTSWPLAWTYEGGALAPPFRCVAERCAAELQGDDRPTDRGEVLEHPWSLATGPSGPGRPELRDRPAEQHAARHVARIVNAEGDAGRGDRDVEERERTATDDADVELAGGDPRERRQDGGVTRRPRSAVRLRDQPAGAVGIGQERPRTIDDPLQALEGEPRGGRARQGAAALPAAAGQRERAGRGRRRVHRPGLGHRAERPIEVLRPFGVGGHEQRPVELPAVLRAERGVSDQRAGSRERCGPDDPCDAHRSPSSQRTAYRRSDEIERLDPERATEDEPCDEAPTIRTTPCPKRARGAPTGERDPA